jgi:hypothetical protein
MHGFPLLIMDIIGEDIAVPAHLQGRIEQLHEYLRVWLSTYAHTA